MKNLLHKQNKVDPSIKPLYKDLFTVYKQSISNFYLGVKLDIYLYIYNYYYYDSITI